MGVFNTARALGRNAMNSGIAKNTVAGAKSFASGARFGNSIFKTSIGTSPLVAVGASAGIGATIGAMSDNSSWQEGAIKGAAVGTAGVAGLVATGAGRKMLYGAGKYTDATRSALRKNYINSGKSVGKGIW